MEEDTAASTAILLPHELVLAILAHLPLPDLLNASLVSKEFNALSEDNSLWESLYRVYISSQPVHPRPDRWKERCLGIMNGILVLFPSERNVKNRIMCGFYRRDDAVCDESKNPDGYKKLLWSVYVGHDRLVAHILEKSGTSLVNLLATKMLVPPYPPWFGDDLQQSLIRYQDSLLHVAAVRNWPLIVEQLLEAGSNVDHRAVDQETPLYFASRFGHLEVMKILLAHKANIEASNTSGGTPLQRAAREGKLEAMKLLIANKADLHAKTIYGTTVVSEARDNGRQEIVKYLKENWPELF